LALSVKGARVLSFDLPGSVERRVAFRGATEQAWYQHLKTANPLVDIHFYNLALLKISEEDFQHYMGDTWLILLDTFHLPYTAPFEREWFQRLTSKLAPKFEGIILLDDIRLNAEMKKWWVELKGSAAELGFRAFDVTAVGHLTGTGLLDFSGKVDIKK